MPEYGNMGVVSTVAVWVLELAVLKMQKSVLFIYSDQIPLAKSDILG